MQISSTEPIDVAINTELDGGVLLDDLVAITPAAPSQTKELPVEVLNTGDTELPEPPSSGGREPDRIETAASDSISPVQTTESGQPMASNIAGDTEAVETSAGTEAQTQPPSSDRAESSSSPSSSDAEVEADSDPCLDESSDDTDDDSDDEDGMITREDLDRFMADPKKNNGLLSSLDDDEIPRTKNEIDPSSIDIPDRRTMLIPSSAKLYTIGIISSFVEGVMVIKASEGTPTVDIGSALALGDRSPLGWIDDIIGPVDFPFYLVRLRDDHGLGNEQIAPGTLVFAIEELCQYLKMSTLDTKGTDASHQNDEENPDIVEYSDDEEERNAKKKAKAPRRATGPPQPRNHRPPPASHGPRRFRPETRQPYPGTDFPSSYPNESLRTDSIRPPYQGAAYYYDQYYQAEPRLEYGADNWQSSFPSQRHPN